VTAQERGLEVRVGAFVLGASALLCVFFFVVGNPALGPGIHLKLRYAFTGPIKEGASVRISGVTVGKVQDVEFVGERPKDATPGQPLVRLHVFIEQRAQPLLTEGTRFYVTTLGVLGEHYVDVIPGPPLHPLLADGGEVRGVDLPRTDLLMARMANLMEQVGGWLEKNELEVKDLMTATAALIRRVDTTLATTDVPTFLQDVQATLADARVVLESARRVLKDPDAVTQLLAESRAMMSESRETLADGRELITALQTRGTALMDRGDGIMTRASDVAVRVDTLLRALEKSGLSDEKRVTAFLEQSENIMEGAVALSRRADGLLSQIEKGQGSLGKLMKDEQVYEDLKALLRELRENPWKIMVPGK
jgi:phospholipid/cholesterol/gamma-HCH transport system substrate-binding protein